MSLCDVSHSKSLNLKLGIGRTVSFVTDVLIKHGYTNLFLC
jgi:hypothetical protein